VVTEGVTGTETTIYISGEEGGCGCPAGHGDRDRDLHLWRVEAGVVAEEVTGTETTIYISGT
jgi:hypothetical protein